MTRKSILERSARTKQTVQTLSDVTIHVTLWPYLVESTDIVIGSRRLWWPRCCSRVSATHARVKKNKGWCHNAGAKMNENHHFGGRRLSQFLHSGTDDADAMFLKDRAQDEIHRSSARSCAEQTGSLQHPHSDGLAYTTSTLR